MHTVSLSIIAETLLVHHPAVIKASSVGPGSERWGEGSYKLSAGRRADGPGHNTGNYANSSVKGSQ